MLALAIDTASHLAGVALTEDGELLAELTWRTHRNHSRELLPTIDSLLQRLDRRKDEIDAVFVCLGPGSYAGLRVGVSTAKALALGLDAAVLGVGRLAADADRLALTGGPDVIAVHAAGRAELAWARYGREAAALQERTVPSLGSRDALLSAVDPGVIVCGDLDDPLATALLSTGALFATPPAARVDAVARLGWQRFARGEVDNTEALVPLYLREPAIGPQPPR